jgi:hypothetical protein
VALLHRGLDATRQVTSNKRIALIHTGPGPRFRYRTNYGYMYNYNYNLSSKIVFDIPILTKKTERLLMNGIPAEKRALLS